jgi:drug/metabolite transporter (DMT)-like permease
LAQSRFFPYLVLLVGVLVAATSSILVRLAQNGGAPSLVIAAWRLVLAVIILTPLAWRRGKPELLRLSRRDWRLGALAGVFLAVHMATWIASLAYTSVASSAALVTTNPLWVTLAVFVLFRERPKPITLIGLAAAITGSVLIAFSDGGVLALASGGEGGVALAVNWQAILAPTGKADTALFGDGLALVGAVTASGYLLIGRNLRRRLSTTVYVWLVYTAAMITLVAVVLAARQPFFGYAPIVYVWLLLLAVGPQLISHTTFNWALAHLSTTFVALSILGEPVGSAIFAYFFFGEAFAPIQLAGFVLLLGGISLGVAGEQ